MALNSLRTSSSVSAWVELSSPNTQTREAIGNRIIVERGRIKIKLEWDEERKEEERHEESIIYIPITNSNPSLFLSLPV